MFLNDDLLNLIWKGQPTNWQGWMRATSNTHLSVRSSWKRYPVMWSHLLQGILQKLFIHIEFKHISCIQVALTSLLLIGYCFRQFVFLEHNSKLCCHCSFDRNTFLGPLLLFLSVCRLIWATHTWLYILKQSSQFCYSVAYSNDNVKHLQITVDAEQYEECYKYTQTHALSWQCCMYAQKHGPTRAAPDVHSPLQFFTPSLMQPTSCRCWQGGVKLRISEVVCKQNKM